MFSNFTNRCVVIQVAHKIDLARGVGTCCGCAAAPIEIRVAHARDRYALGCDPQIAHPADIYAQIVKNVQLENGNCGCSSM